MADKKKVQEEDLRKLEDEAYFELCQIIAEAMELQDVDLLNARIASWKTKYKKLLDRPSTNSKSDFKKRIEFLLNQYYSEVTKYILSQLKLKEEKKVENQAKAIRELYTIIRDTNDYDLLKKKVDKWKEKYPVSGFLKMYQKRIELYTRDKNIRENAFKQEEAFSDLIDITKVHGTLDELKNELALWEEKYSINDKYTIDDFLKHQTEVKRYTSDEFLQSIAREESNPDNVDRFQIDLVEEYNNNSFSNLSVQASAYATLLKISKAPNAVNEMFTWVYKNRGVKFNDKYKELILSATYLEYSPAYLNKIPRPQMDMSKASLSFDEYNNLDNIKRYAIISYFNLLLPPDKAVANDYFNKNIQTIYAKSERARTTSIKDESTPTETPFNSSIDIQLEQTSDISYETQTVLAPGETMVEEACITEDSDSAEIILDLSDNESGLTIDLETSTTSNNETLEMEITTDDNIKITEPELALDDENSGNDLSTIEIDTKIETILDDDPITPQPEGIVNSTTEDHEETFSYDTVVSLSPLFFEAIYNYNTQAVLVRHIDSTVTQFVESEKAQEASLDEPIKTKIDEE